ncbi:MAG: tRNA lysidine(34) synthetase TilS [Pseudomonadales bacterium]|jgi:tRNA(Ile)-lysidine synthase|nr:tRNA lysidine(34) synthetase TilS [Pseudomonadales bacterium]MDP7144155.1 tRNA lysidine(34) synthetase TilS [Pseudomonadales bacterium]MDP7357739.1 tRNA lysidine(34) synthetase TilS [Pseudomonadales bacterium]MDP7596184.1 tRNA lysidine(34) synthetase TilS [Pseudomonadales bacterium]HJN50442.1 tRNA lysidine(34) synthetase TilS [Pseudomonadales bacterium]|tara:strand:+ start:55 stop:1422 length:1368 start_codon:yes stop_codon:yes gene_type:complete
MIKPESLQYLFSAPGSRLVVGYSGGMDSHVLLHLLASLKKEHSFPTEIHALHINHGVSPQSNTWQDHCEMTCKKLEVDFAAINVSVELAGRGTEDSAREVRYRAFGEYLVAGDNLLLAHHADDQAETILYRLTRGSGLKGLGGMPKRRKLGAATLLRPLLHVARESLQDYAEQEGLQWIEDESNRDTRLDRNYIRHNLIPVIKERWPGYARTWTRSALLAAEGSDLNRELADLDLRKLSSGNRGRIDLTKLQSMSHARQRNLLCRWIECAALPLPSNAQLQQLVVQFAAARQDANPVVRWQGAEVRRFRNHAYLMQPLAQHDERAELHLNSDQSLFLAVGTLTVKQTQGGGIWLKDGLSSVVIRFRQGGERCHPSGRVGSHPLKKILQELRVPPWLRDRIPLICVGDQIAAVAGLFNCQGFSASEAQIGWEFRWSFSGSGSMDFSNPRNGIEVNH